MFLWEEMSSTSSNSTTFPCIYLLTFCLDDLSIDISEMLKSTNKNVLLSISAFNIMLIIINTTKLC